MPATGALAATQLQLLRSCTLHYVQVVHYTPLERGRENGHKVIWIRWIDINFNGSNDSYINNSIDITSNDNIGINIGINIGNNDINIDISVNVDNNGNNNVVNINDPTNVNINVVNIIDPNNNKKYTTYGDPQNP